jgi:hypothetical protein
MSPDPESQGLAPAAPRSESAPPQKSAPAPLRVKAAWAVALAADALQLAIFPLMVAGGASVLDDVVDVIVAIVLISLLGWNLAFLPSIAIKLLPAVDLAPMWTLAVAFVTRRRAPARR